MANTNIIINFDQANPALETVGGKGLNLIRLTSAGIPVPPGFVVSTSAYQKFLEENQLSEEIES